MDNRMFCFQCEQTAGCTGCRGLAGVCGKKSDTANLQDELTGALIGLARAAEKTSQPVSRFSAMITDGLFTTVTNVSFDNASIQDRINEIHQAKELILKEAGAAASLGQDAEDYRMKEVWDGNEDIRSLKSLILFGMRGTPKESHP